MAVSSPHAEASAVQAWLDQHESNHLDAEFWRRVPDASHAEFRRFVSSVKGILVRKFEAKTPARAEIRQLFFTCLLAEGLPLDLARLAGWQRSLNDEKRVCLWLAGLVRHNVGPGLWQMFADADTPRPPLPPIIGKVCSPRGEDDEGAHCIERMNSKARPFLEAVQARNAGSLAGSQLLAWVVETEVNEREPGTAARELANHELDGAVHQALHLARNTLKLKFLEPVYRTITVT